jgi:hypothetical protein
MLPVVADRVHRQRDLWVSLAIGVPALGAGAAISIWAAELGKSHVGFWPHAGEIAGLVLVALGLYIIPALLFSWWLPGGFRHTDPPVPPTAGEAGAIPSVDPPPAAVPGAPQQAELASPPPANPAPLLLTVEDEAWDLWRRVGYICAILLKITNTTGRAITVINYGVGTGWQRGPDDAPLQISQEDQRSLRDEARARERRNHYGAPLRTPLLRIWLQRRPRLTVPAEGYVSGWLVTDCPRPSTGGRPRCTIKVTDSLGNTYTKVIEQRDPQHYES